MPLRHQTHPIECSDVKTFVRIAERVFRSVHYIKICMNVGRALDAKYALNLVMVTSDFRPEWLKAMRNRVCLTTEQKYEILDYINERIAYAAIEESQNTIAESIPCQEQETIS